MLINLRNRNIINLITNNPLTLEQISIEIKVSTRTIRRDFLIINHILEQNGYTIDKQQKKYVIYDSKNKLRKILDKNNQLDFNSKEKTLIYMSYLCYGNNEVNAQTIADDLYVSVEKVKEQIRQLLLRHNIKYGYKKNKFIVDIQANQKLIIFNEIISNYFLDYKLEEIIVSESINILGINKIKKYLNYYFNTDDFTNVFNTIQEAFNTYQIYINDQELFNLTIKILISLKQEVDIKSIKTVENLVPSKVSEYIIKQLHVQTKPLINYIVNEVSSLVTEFEVEKIDYEHIYDIQNLVNKFFEHFNFENINTQDLEYKILLHDKRTKLNQNVSILKETIAVIEDLIQNNLKVFKILKEINEELNLYSIEELKYVFIYFVMEIENLVQTNNYNILVICSGGVGSSLMIKNQLQRFLPNCNIKNVSLTKALNIDYQSMDLIISLTKLPNNIEDIVVNHIITPEDFTSIKNKLIDKKVDIKNEVKNPKFYISEINDEFKTNDQSLKLNLKELKNQNKIDDADYLYQKLKKRELLGIAIPTTNIAFYHTRSSSIKQPVILIINCKSFKVLGLDMKNQKCNVILLLLLPELVEEKVVNKVNSLSYELITNKELTDDLEQFKLQKLEEIIR